MRWPLIRYLPSHTHIDFVKLAPFAAVLSALAVAGLDRAPSSPRA